MENIGYIGTAEATSTASGILGFGSFGVGLLSGAFAFGGEAIGQWILCILLCEKSKASGLTRKSYTKTFLSVR